MNKMHQRKAHEKRKKKWKKNRALSIYAHTFAYFIIHSSSRSSSSGSHEGIELRATGLNTKTAKGILRK